MNIKDLHIGQHYTFKDDKSKVCAKYTGNKQTITGRIVYIFKILKIYSNYYNKTVTTNIQIFQTGIEKYVIDEADEIIQQL